MILVKVNLTITSNDQQFLYYFFTPKPNCSCVMALSNWQWPVYRLQVNFWKAKVLHFLVTPTTERAALLALHQ